MTLVAFDFDGTLSDSEMTVLLGERMDRLNPDRETPVAEEMDAITARAMNDEIGYTESLRKRAGLLAGLPLQEAEAAFDRVALRPGSADLIAALNTAGVTTAILTGGFQRGVEASLESEGVAVDHVIANRLPADGELTGEVEGPLVEGTKDTALENLAETEGVGMDETIAVGDGANDLPMLRVAGLAVGFEPKPAVQPGCDVVVSSMAELQELLEDQGMLAGAE